MATVPLHLRSDVSSRSTRFDLRVGDLAVFCGFHKVTPVVGSRRRITMGGFLSFSPTKDKVLYWS